MKAKIFFVACAMASFPLTASAGDSVGGCGWGSRLMRGNSGVFPQIFAVTTNGTSGNQTFGISSGTSGCSQNGTVNSNWNTAMYIDGNKNKLARDMSRGSGESLESLASLLGVTSQDKDLFFAATKENFAKIFPNTEVSQFEVMASLKDVMTSTAGLEQYSARL